MTRPSLDWLKSIGRLARFPELRSDGRAYTVSHTTTVAANGGSMNVHLKNPTGQSDPDDIDIVTFAPVTQFEGKYTVYDSFSSAPSGGTELGIDNMVMDSDNQTDTGIAVANGGVSFTDDGDPHLELPIPSGGGDSQGLGTFGGRGIGTEPIIEPGREIVIELTNESESEELGGIVVVYTEDGEYFE